VQSKGKRVRVRILDAAAFAVALPNVVTMDLRFSFVLRTLYKNASRTPCELVTLRELSSFFFSSSVQLVPLLLIARSSPLPTPDPPIILAHATSLLGIENKE
jgi:hypothetical protein